jgi:hypothetical protein
VILNWDQFEAFMREHPHKPPAPQSTAKQTPTKP